MTEIEDEVRQLVLNRFDAKRHRDQIPFRDFAVGVRDNNMSLYGKINLLVLQHLRDNPASKNADLFREKMRQSIHGDFEKASNAWTCGQFAQAARSCGLSEEEIVATATLLFK